MEDHKARRRSPSLNGSIDLIKPILVNDRKVSYQDLKNEYSKAISYIDSLKVDKSNLMETIKLLSNRKPEASVLGSPASSSQLKGALMAETDKKCIQLEQENRELRRTVSEYRSREHVGNDKRVIGLEQENTELKKTLEMKSDQIMTLQKEAFAQREYNEIERLEKSNRHLKKQVELLTQDLEIITKKFQQLEEENVRIAGASAIPKETAQTVIKYINYILNTINTFQPSNPLRSCFEERFTSPMEVHRLVNANDYVPLLLKCLKFISDILITTDKKSDDANPLSIRTMNVQEMMVSNILENQGLQPSAQKRKSVGINRANTPLGRSSGSLTVNTSLAATNCQTPSGISTQERKVSATRKHVRTPSQEIAFMNSGNDESHIVYKSQQSTRNPDKIMLRDLQQDNVISPKIMSPKMLSPKTGNALDRERRSQSGLARRTPQTTPLDTSMNNKEIYINERENEYVRLDQDLQKKKERIRDLSRELDRMENKDAAPEALSSSNVVIRERKGSHKRVNTDSCISIKELVTEPDQSYSTSRNPKEGDRSVIRLKPVLKASTYTSNSKEREREYDTNTDAGRSALTGAYLNPYTSPKDQLHELTRKFQALEASTGARNQDNMRIRSPIRGHEEPRSRIRPETPNEVSNYRDDRIEEYERARRPRRGEDNSIRHTDEDLYQPKVLPRPQPKDRLEDFAVGNTSLSKSYSRGKIAVGANIGNPYAEVAHNRVTFDTEHTGEDERLLQRNPSTRSIGGFRSPVNANLNLRGTNYASFQVAFGRTETRDRISPTPQEKRALSPSVLDIPARKRVDHVDQTYDMIRGEEKRLK